MKRWLVCTAVVMAMASCGNNGNSGTTENTSDTLSPVAADTATGGDTTGLNVGAAQPVDSANQLRPPMGNEPGARKSGVHDQIDTGTRMGVDTGARRSGQ